MSGIAGWVEFNRDLTRWRSTIQAMTATLAWRGPDDEGIWADRHVALGHRRLAVVDPEGGHQPMVAEEDGRPLAAIVYSGALYNLHKLRDGLAACGHPLRTRSDAEVALRAYLEWGPGCAERLDGMFAFAVWDLRREELILVRDRLGLKPLYYYPIPSGVLFGSEPKAILANPLVEPVVDAEGLCEILAYAGTPTHAVFHGMRKVRAGTVVRVNRAGTTQQRYWALSALPHTDDLKTTVDTVRGLLEDSVACQMASDTPVGSLLSGGIDSSTVVGLVARTARGQPPRTYTVTFVDYEEHFRPDDVRATPDGPYVRDVVDYVGADHVDIVLDTADLMDPIARAAVLRGKDLPTPFGDMNTSLYLLCLAVSDHVSVVLSGETADSVFAGNAWSHDSELVNIPTFPWITLAQRHGARFALGCGLIHQDVLKRLDLPGYCADRCQEAFTETPMLPGLSESERRMRQDSYLHLTRWAENQLANSERPGMAVGLEIRMPYTDHRLVEYVFNTPWEMKTYDGREKSLLRAAAGDLVPQSVLQRPKSPFPITADPAYQQSLRDALIRIDAEGGSPIAPLLDTRALRALLDRPSGLPTDWITRTDVEMVLSLDAWLRSNSVRLAL